MIGMLIGQAIRGIDTEYHYFLPVVFTSHWVVMFLMSKDSDYTSSNCN